VASPPPLPSGVQEVLAQYRRAHDLEVRLWEAQGDAWRLIDPPGVSAPAGPSSVAVRFGDGLYCLELVNAAAEKAPAQLDFLASVVERLLTQDEEIRTMTREIADRYEEITLLYSISETLGSVISIAEGADIILSEVISTLGARRAALWVHDPKRNELYLAADVGMEGQKGPVQLDDPTSVTATVFRTARAVIMDPDEVFPRGQYDRGITHRGSFLSVPVSYTPPRGEGRTAVETRTVGVINLVGRRSDEPFTAGDMRLLTAIASQVGAAVENARLIAESLYQERLDRELELAHDLQLKLLPSAESFAGYAQVAARCLPADRVGGDFYHLFRLSGGRIGVMIGDVASHGFAAALIMALTMSAVAIHASEGDAPSEVLRRVHRTLIDELESTEMFLTLFYGVIDPAAGTLTYANAGHHHAFRFPADGGPERLGSTNPPFGMVDLDGYAEASAVWRSDEDLLFLFTDGLSDAFDGGMSAGERKLLEVVGRGRQYSLDSVLDELFRLAASEAGGVALDDRTALLVRI
jgi:phosphoserine phosphatase RsbU/P